MIREFKAKSKSFTCARASFERFSAMTVNVCFGAYKYLFCEDERQLFMPKMYYLPIMSQIAMSALSVFLF